MHRLPRRRCMTPRSPALKKLSGLFAGRPTFHSLVQEGDSSSAGALPGRPTGGKWQPGCCAGDHADLAGRRPAGRIALPQEPSWQGTSHILPISSVWATHRQFYIVAVSQIQPFGEDNQPVGWVLVRGSRGPEEMLTLETGDRSGAKPDRGQTRGRHQSVLPAPDWAIDPELAHRLRIAVKPASRRVRSNLSAIMLD